MRSMSMLNSVVMVFDNVNPCLVLTVCVFVSSYNCHLRCSFAVLKLKMGIFEIIIVFIDINYSVILLRALFTSTKKHKIFRHMHGVLNIDENKN